MGDRRAEVTHGEREGWEWAERGTDCALRKRAEREWHFEALTGREDT